MKKDEPVLTHGGKHVDVDALRGNVPKGWTEEDWRAHVDKLARAVEHVPALLSFLGQNKPQALKTKLPFALVSEGDIAPGGQACIEVHPQRPMRPMNIVLTDDTAKAFDLDAALVGVNFQQGSCDHPLPLEPFAIGYIANAKDPEHVLRLNEWPFDVCQPGMVVRFQVHNRGPLPLQFRGILWGVAGSW